MSCFGVVLVKNLQESFFYFPYENINVKKKVVVVSHELEKEEMINNNDDGTNLLETGGWR
jgi:hypothetical protein